MSTVKLALPLRRVRVESWVGGQNLILTSPGGEVLLGGTDDQLNAFADEVKRAVRENQQRRLEDEGGIPRGTRVKVRTHGGGKARKVWRVTLLVRSGSQIIAWLNDEGGSMACSSPLSELEVVEDGD